jgi:hypothetical protein
MKEALDTNICYFIALKLIRQETDRHLFREVADRWSSVTGSPQELIFFS